jgi:hypothetical protein
MKAARILNGVVAEIVTVPDGHKLQDLFHKDAGFVPCADPGVTLGMAYAGGRFSPAPIPPPPGKAELAEIAARLRRRTETGGITAPLGSASIAMPSDRETQSQLAGAAAFAQANPGATIQWKLADGSFVALAAAQIVAIAVAVATHVQACFAAEASVAAAIAAGTVTTVAQIEAAFAAIA